MTDKYFVAFREALKALPFCGTSIKDFALRAGIKPQTLYNYISGQRPSIKYFEHTLRGLIKYYPDAIEIAKEKIGGTFDETIWWQI